MIAALAAAVYLAGFVITARVYCATSNYKERGEARFDGTCLGLIWPAALAIGVVIGLLALPTLGVRTRAERREAARRERRRLAEHIAELEAENERLRKGQETA